MYVPIRSELTVSMAGCCSEAALLVRFSEQVCQRVKDALAPARLADADDLSRRCSTEVFNWWGEPLPGRLLIPSLSSLPLSRRETEDIDPSEISGAPRHRPATLLTAPNNNVGESHSAISAFLTSFPCKSHHRQISFLLRWSRRPRISNCPVCLVTREPFMPGRTARKTAQDFYQRYDIIRKFSYSCYICHGLLKTHRIRHSSKWELGVVTLSISNVPSES